MTPPPGGKPPKPPRKRSKRIATGIRRRPNGRLEAYVEALGRTRSKTFPAGTPRRTIEAWRAEQREALGGVAATSGDGTLAGDIRIHAASLRANTTFDEQVTILERWAEALGPARRRGSISRHEIEEVAAGWLERGMAAATVRKRLQMLQALWTSLDGEEARNPVRSVRRPTREPTQARGLPTERVRALLGAIRSEQSRTICRVIAWTGLTHQQLRELKPADIDWDSRSVRTRGRRKGRGAPARFVPLLDEGLEALRAFDAADLYGKVNNQTVWKHVKEAARAIGDPGIRPYDLRHSFATLVYEATGDLTTTAYLLGHADEGTTRRYALNAIPSVARAGIEKTEALLNSRKRRPA